MKITIKAAMSKEEFLALPKSEQKKRAQTNKRLARFLNGKSGKSVGPARGQKTVNKNVQKDLNKLNKEIKQGGGKATPKQKERKKFLEQTSKRAGGKLQKSNIVDSITKLSKEQNKLYENIKDIKQALKDTSDEKYKVKLTKQLSEAVKKNESAKAKLKELIKRRKGN